MVSKIRGITHTVITVLNIGIRGCQSKRENDLSQKLSIVPESRSVLPRGGGGTGEREKSLRAMRKLLGVMECSLS